MANTAFSLPRQMDLIAAAELHKQLKTLVEGDNDLLVDGANVERVTTPCIEILIATAKSVQESDRKFVVQNPSENIADAFATLGLSGLLESWRI